MKAQALMHILSFPWQLKENPKGRNFSYRKFTVTLIGLLKDSFRSSLWSFNWSRDELQQRPQQVTGKGIDDVGKAESGRISNQIRRRKGTSRQKPVVSISSPSQLKYRESKSRLSSCSGLPCIGYWLQLHPQGKGNCAIWS